MSKQLEHIAFKETLLQSEFAGDQYKKIFYQTSSSFNNPLIEEVEEIYNQVISQYDEITEHQILVLTKIIDKLNDVRTIINPNRFKNLKHSITEDDDLLLYRESDNGLVNIIIHPDEDFAFSYIGNIAGRELEFFESQTADFETIVLNFLAK